jgi:DNA-binding MarR family transcriptional regulator
MTRIVQALENQGLVAKRVDASDRRSVRLNATMKGQRLLIQARRERTRALAQRVGLLSPQERSALERAIDLMAKLIENRRT